MLENPAFALLVQKCTIPEPVPVDISLVASMRNDKIPSFESYTGRPWPDQCRPRRSKRCIDASGRSSVFGPPFETEEIELGGPPTVVVVVGAESMYHQSPVRPKAGDRIPWWLFGWCLFLFFVAVPASGLTGYHRCLWSIALLNSPRQDTLCSTLKQELTICKALGASSIYEIWSSRCCGAQSYPGGRCRNSCGNDNYDGLSAWLFMTACGPPKLCGKEDQHHAAAQSTVLSGVYDRMMMISKSWSAPYIHSSCDQVSGTGNSTTVLSDLFTSIISPAGIPIAPYRNDSSVQQMAATLCIRK